MVYVREQRGGSAILAQANRVAQAKIAVTQNLIMSSNSLRRLAHELGGKTPRSGERYSPKRESVMDCLWLQDSPPRRENFGV